MPSNLAYLYNLQGEHELALEHTLKSLEIHPLAAVPSFQLGNIYFELGKVEKAVQQLQRCIGFVLNYHACHLELAFIQRLIGQSQAAQQTFEDMLSSRPGLADFWVVLNQGFHAWWQNDLALASSYYDQLYLPCSHMLMATAKACLNIIEEAKTYRHQSLFKLQL